MLHELREALHAQLERHRNRPFLEAAMAASALVAMADHKLSLSESQRVDDIIDRLRQLKLFDPHVAKGRFNDYAAAIEADPKRGRAEALEAIGHFAGDTPMALLLLRVCLAVSRADGELHAGEKAQIKSICGTLGVTLKDLGR